MAPNSVHLLSASQDEELELRLRPLTLRNTSHSMVLLAPTTALASNFGIAENVCFGIDNSVHSASIVLQ